MSISEFVRRGQRAVNDAPLGWLLLPALAVIPTILYWFGGYRGDDALFHLTSLLELRRAFQAHSWELGWASGANYGFGSPRLSFYPPFDVLLATGLSFVLPIRWVPGLQLWLLLSTAGVSMYVAAGRLAGREHRISAALFFMFSGYLLLATIVRYDIAEAWVDAVLPLNFLLFVQVTCREQKRMLIPAALLFGLAWLTNVPAAIVLFYTFGFSAAVIAVQRRRAAPLLLYGCVLVLSLGLAAFRLGPVLVEQKWIHPEALRLFDVGTNMILRRLPAHPAASLFLNASALVSAAFFVIGALSMLRKTGPKPPYLLPLFLVVGIALILQLPPSMFLWRHLPELAYVSFPFRFQIFLALAVPLTLFSSAAGWRLRATAWAVYILLAVYPVVAFSRTLPEHRIPPMAQAVQQWANGYPEVPEYLPARVPINFDTSIAADAGRLALARKTSGCNAAPVLDSPDRSAWRLSTTAGCELTVGTFCYPYWRAHLEDGANIPLRCTALSLIEAEIPAGAHVLTLQFDPTSPVRTLTAFVSVAIFLSLLGAWFLARRAGSRVIMHATPATGGTGAHHLR